MKKRNSVGLIGITTLLSALLLLWVWSMEGWWVDTMGLVGLFMCGVWMMWNEASPGVKE